MKRLTIYTFAICAIAGSAFAGDGEGFERIKDKLSSAGCIEMKFLSILKSDIFETTDTTEGSAFLAADGRYRVDIGPDVYLNDFEQIWSYSGENNQVTVEPYVPDDPQTDQFVFVTRLDEFYESAIIQPDRSYRLTKRQGVKGDYPDSMTVVINADLDQIEEMKYYDLNNELNRIVILKTSYLPDCGKNTFKANFPDSVEVIKL